MYRGFESLPLRHFRTANAGRSRFCPRGGGEGSEQIAFRSHDPDFTVRDLDALGKGAKVVAPIAAAVDRDPLSRRPRELTDHLRRDRLLA